MNFKKYVVSTLTVACLTSIGTMSLAGDPGAGEKVFNKCKSCHMIVSPSGEEIVKGGKTGPNLYGVVGRQAASYEGFKYGKSLAELGETGFKWTEEDIAGFITDPKSWLAEKNGDKKARSNMSFKLNKGQEDVVAYLASIAPVESEESKSE